jgi:hypothetical protein
MSDEKSADIDPRFDPAFQRGFDQSIPIEEYVPEPSARKTIVAEPEQAPVAPRPAAVIIPAAPQLDATERSLVDTEDPPNAVSEPDTSADLDSSPSRNPFLLFLGIIAIALVAVGIWLFVRSGDAFNSRDVPSQGAFMSLTSTITVAPFIALLGAATAIGVLFVFASRWRRRR